MLAKRENSEAVRILIRMGADVSLTNRYGVTAVEAAENFMVYLRWFVRHNGQWTSTLTNTMRRNVDVFKAEVHMTSQTAFAMRLHPRLGRLSDVMLLNPEVLRMVLDLV